MTDVNQALGAALRPVAPPVPLLAVASAQRVVVVGAAGPLGGAVLERLLAVGGFAAVSALVTQPVEVALRGFQAWQVAAGPAQAPAGEPSRAMQADSAVLVFDRAHGTRHGREAAFLRPQPSALAATGHWLLAAGVRRLVVVLPHAPALLPQALRAGLASLDEQALAALGFEHLVFVRPSQLGRDGRDAPAGAAPAQRLAVLHRLARALLSQLQWMVPQRDQPLRALRVAQFVVDLLRGLPGSKPGTRVVPPELVWDWTQPGGGDALLGAWLAGHALPQVATPAQRW